MSCGLALVIDEIIGRVAIGCFHSRRPFGDVLVFAGGACLVINCGSAGDLVFQFYDADEEPVFDVYDFELVGGSHNDLVAGFRNVWRESIRLVVEDGHIIASAE